MTTSRGRRDPSLLDKGPAASPSLEDKRAAQLRAVAEVEAAMRTAAPAAAEPEAEVAPEERVPTSQERYQARLDDMEPSETRWKVGLRAKGMRVEDHLLRPGDIVPGADTWPRRDSWEAAGYIERA